MDISLAPEVIFSIGEIPISNSLFTGIFLTILLTFLVFISVRAIKYDNPGRTQLFFEIFFGALYNLVRDIAGNKLAKEIFPFVSTFFVIIVVANLFALTPIVPTFSVIKEEEHHEEIIAASEPIVTAKDAESTDDHDSNFFTCLLSKHCYLTTAGISEPHETAHLFRPPSSDLSFTIALAAISVVVTNLIGLFKLKLDFIKKFINFSNPVNFFVGILEMISELGKIVSFSFRLFGNIFAGEILLIVITFITFGVATLPFYLLEIFVAFIQALVFFMLTTVFINLAVSTHEH